MASESKFEQYGLDQLVACRKPGPRQLWAMKVAVFLILGVTVIAAAVAVAARFLL